MLPLRHQVGNSSPIFNYRYDRSREALHDLTRMGDADEWDGYKMRYVNPVTGGYPMPSMGAFLQLQQCVAYLTRGENHRQHYLSRGGRQRPGHHWRTDHFPGKDIFVVPTWHAVSFNSAEDTVLFSFFGPSRAGSARPVPRSALLKMKNKESIMTHHVFAPQAPISVPVVGSDEQFPVRRAHCVGRNYAAHAREMGFDPDREPPFFFCSLR